MNGKLLLNILAVVAVMAFAACSDGRKDKGEGKPKSESVIDLKGDSTIYGLVCDGCTDSVLVVLPGDMGDPVRYDIIDATQEHKVFGKMRIGDRVAILLDPTDRKVAQMAVNLDDLKGTWCYEVMPQLRDFATMSKRMQRRMMQNMPDSVKQTFLVPREYGFTLKREYTASPVGFVAQGNALEDESPVVYPHVPLYCEWRLWNGKLLLARNVGKGGFGRTVRKQDVRIDTARILMLRADTLVLQFADHVQGYHSHASEQEVNKEARSIAAQQARKAIDNAK